MKAKTIIFWIFILVIADQAIKIIINAFFLECQVEIIPSLFEFSPTFNDKHSYVNDLLYRNFHINMGLWFHIILFLIIEIVVFTMYACFKSAIFNNKRLLDFAFTIQLAGVVCAFFGNLIWEKGTLDYIYLKPLFVFDLKDLYMNCFVVLFLIYTHKNNAEIKKIKMKDVALHVKHYLKKKQ